jgi:hypothetical protein
MYQTKERETRKRFFINKNTARQNDTGMTID